MNKIYNNFNKTYIDALIKRKRVGKLIKLITDNQFNWSVSNICYIIGKTYTNSNNLYRLFMFITYNTKFINETNIRIHIEDSIVAICNQSNHKKTYLSYDFQKFIIKYCWLLKKISYKYYIGLFRMISYGKFGIIKYINTKECSSNAYFKKLLCRTFRMICSNSHNTKNQYKILSYIVNMIMHNKYYKFNSNDINYLICSLDNLQEIYNCLPSESIRYNKKIARLLFSDNITMLIPKLHKTNRSKKNIKLFNKFFNYGYHQN